ncbi:MAG: hypothetical protein U0V73_11355 [Acidimicrobiia bacterium]
MTSAWRRCVGIALVGAVAAGVVLGLHLRRLEGAKLSGHPYVSTFEHPSSSLEKALALGDGMAYAALARDPTLARPELFRPAAYVAAYRAERPLYAYVTWIGSGDRRGRYPS